MAEEAPKTTPPPAAEPEAAPATDKPAEAAAPPAAAAEDKPSDLLTSARTLAEAAQAAATQHTDQIDKAKVAEAAEDILEAAKSSGKLGEKEGVGQYLDKAQDYLHSMHSDEKKDDKEESGSAGGLAGGFMKAATGFFK